jgi:ABC-type nitrate/sulfonate/bicarbonate transport system ATPase subunit
VAETVEAIEAVQKSCPCKLSVKGLGRTFRNGGREVQAVRSLDLAIPAGSFTVIVGPSGCGKTTFLRLLAGLESADAGQIDFDGPVRPPNRSRFGFMFQDARLLPWLTVEENLRLALPPKAGAQGAGEIARLLRLVGLEGGERIYPRRLSGGMAQRVALARALCRKSEILLLDEPFGALDAFTRSRLRRDLDELWKSLNVTVILVTHDIEEAVFLADRVIRMKNGSIEGEVPVSLPRPRDQRSPEFQDLCRYIEDRM